MCVRVNQIPSSRASPEISKYEKEWSVVDFVQLRETNECCVMKFAPRWGRMMLIVLRARLAMRYDKLLSIELIRLIGHQRTTLLM